MEIIKNDKQEPNESGKPDLSGTIKLDDDGNVDLNSIFIVQVTNHKGEVAYMGTEDGKNIAVNKICRYVTKFGNYESAKAFANTIKGAKTEILGRHRMEKIIAQQENDKEHKVVPLEKIEDELYHVIVKEKESGKLVGYISYSLETQEYSVIEKPDGAAFWTSVEKADLFITVATEQFLSKHPELTLEKSLIKKA